ncbi:MAG: hypothetical protein V1838_02155 [Patescibacteria group bacterium]
MSEVNKFAQTRKRLAWIAGLIAVCILIMFHSNSDGYYFGTIMSLLLFVIGFVTFFVTIVTNRLNIIRFVVGIIVLAIVFTQFTSIKATSVPVIIQHRTTGSYKIQDNWIQFRIPFVEKAVTFRDITLAYQWIMRDGEVTLKKLNTAVHTNIDPPYQYLIVDVTFRCVTKPWMVADKQSYDVYKQTIESAFADWLLWHKNRYHIPPDNSDLMKNLEWRLPSNVKCSWDITRRTET